MGVVRVMGVVGVVGIMGVMGVMGGEPHGQFGTSYKLYL